MKQPSKTLPAPERLSDYPDHLVVFTSAKPGTRESEFGPSIVDVLTYVYVNGSWKSLGEVPIFWVTVAGQIKDAGDEPLGGLLVHGTERNEKEWALEAVPASAKEYAKALVAWETEHSEEF